MNINLSISPAPGITTNKLVIAVYDSTAPATVVSSRVLSAPHVDSVNVSFTNLRRAVYIVKIYESPNDTPSGVLRHSFIYNSAAGSASVRADEVLIVGQTSGFTAGATTYDNTSYSGWEYTIERRGTGSLIDIAKDALDPDYQTKNTGGFTLVKDGDVFGLGEKFVIHFLPKLVEADNQVNQTTGGLWSGEKDITIDITLQASDMWKYCLIQGSAPILNITLPSGASVPNGAMIALISEGGNHKVANIIPSGSDQIKWLGDTWTNNDPFSIHQSEQVWLLYHGNAWRVSQAEGGWKQVGELIYSYRRDQINTIPADGVAYNRDYYPRLWRYIKKFLDPTLLVDASVWAFFDSNNFYPNVGKFSNGDGANTFQTPLLMKTLDSNGNLKSGGYLRAVSGATSNEKAGIQKKDSVGNFYLETSLPVGATLFENITAATAFGKGLNGVYPATIPFEAFVTGADPISKIANGETRPFSTNAYLLIKF